MGTPDGAVDGPGTGPVAGRPARPARSGARAVEAVLAEAERTVGGAPAMELLVHGVGGTPPEAMLGDPHIVRVTGDATAGTYRRWRDRHAERHPGRHPRRVLPEAYSWRGLTSGSAGRALWLLLLPFMVANLAHWMRPARRDPAVAARPAAADAAYDLLVRLAALLLTVLFTATVCEVALDLTAWQCAGSAWCAAHKPWLGFLSAAHGGWWSRPGRRLAVASLVPLGAVALLWWLSHLTWSSYESQRMAPGEGSAAAPPMEQPGFWYGKRLVGRLRVAHVTAALLTVAAAVTVPALRADRAAGRSLDSALGWALTGLLGLLAAGVGGVLGRSWRCERAMDDRVDRLAVRALHWSALGAVAAAALYAGWSRPGWQSHGRLPGSTGVFALLCAGQLLLVPLLAAAAALLARGAPPPQPRPEPVAVPGPARSEQPADEGFGGASGAALGRFAGPATAMLALGLGTLLSAGAAVWAADWLARGATPGAPGVALPGPPPLLTWHAAAVPVVALLLAALLAGLAVPVLRLRSALRPQVEAAYGVVRGGSPQRTGQIATALARARLTECGPLLVAFLAAAAFGAGLAALCGAELTHAIPTEAARGSPQAVAYLAAVAQSLGGWLVGALMVALVGLGRAAYRGAGTRRTVGVLWDIGTFWPRAAHPFAPPCYAERAVPDLVWRLRGWLAADPGRRVVLSAHSQGTVLAAAAVWQLDRATRRRVALLTYGSPLRRLYGRYFPAFMGPADLARLHADAPAWRNLFRVTDPIGGPVRVPGVDAPPFTDPLGYDRDLAGCPLPDPIRAHSDYAADPRYAAERAAVLAETRRGSPGPAP